MKSRVSSETLINLKKDFFRQQSKYDVQLLFVELFNIIQDLKTKQLSLDKPRLCPRDLPVPPP